MLIVAGITRSGLTATMQMLHAGGFPCAGEYPAFEEYDMGQIPWSELSGKAVKAVDTHLQNPPDIDCRVIRLKRNLTEQVRSINKWNRMLMNLPACDESRLKRSMLRDYAKIDAWAIKRPCLTLNFEDIIRIPFQTAQRITEFIGQPLDCVAMGKAIVNRDPACYPGLLELKFM